MSQRSTGHEPTVTDTPVFRVILRMDVEPTAASQFEQVWFGIARSVADHPDNLGQWLMRGLDGPGTYYVVSDWRKEDAFRQFERGEAHREHRRALDEYRRGGWMIATEVVCDLTGAAATA